MITLFSINMLQWTFYWCEQVSFLTNDVNNNQNGFFFVACGESPQSPLKNAPFFELFSLDRLYKHYETLSLTNSASAAHMFITHHWQTSRWSHLWWLRRDVKTRSEQPKAFKSFTSVSPFTWNLELDSESGPVWLPTLSSFSSDLFLLLPASLCKLNGSCAPAWHCYFKGAFKQLEICHNLSSDVWYSTHVEMENKTLLDLLTIQQLA